MTEPYENYPPKLQGCGAFMALVNDCVEWKKEDKLIFSAPNVILELTDPDIKNVYS